MAAIGILTIEMAANVARLQKDMEHARKSVDGAMAKIRQSAALAAKALGAIGIGLSVATLTGFIRGAINAADGMAKMAQKTGLAVEELAGVQLAFRQSGAESASFQMGMAKLTVAISEGNKHFNQMGLSTKNADGSLKSTRQMLGEVADKFASYQDGAAKAALAIKLFGESGAGLIPLLNGGAQGLADYDEKARTLGLTLDTSTAKAAERFNDTLDLAGQGLQGIARQVAA
ncbi:MAG: hypothetical protein GXY54_03750, partial [Deltaproteobacteria bacterium]|nr:hypothetical protein [Deltaproteobacteria bacterium]